MQPQSTCYFRFLFQLALFLPLLPLSSIAEPSPSRTSIGHSQNRFYLAGTAISTEKVRLDIVEWNETRQTISVRVIKDYGAKNVEPTEYFVTLKRDSNFVVPPGEIFEDQFISDTDVRNSNGELIARQGIAIAGTYAMACSRNSEKSSKHCGLAAFTPYRIRFSEEKIKWVGGERAATAPYLSAEEFEFRAATYPTTQSVQTVQSSVSRGNRICSSKLEGPLAAQGE